MCAYSLKFAMVVTDMQLIGADSLAKIPCCGWKGFEDESVQHRPFIRRSMIIGVGNKNSYFEGEGRTKFARISFHLPEYDQFVGKFHERQRARCLWK